VKTSKWQKGLTVYAGRSLVGQVAILNQGALRAFDITPDGKYIVFDRSGAAAADGKSADRAHFARAARPKGRLGSATVLLCAPAAVVRQRPAVQPLSITRTRMNIVKTLL
jgi:hypothetical protein